MGVMVDGQPHAIREATLRPRVPHFSAIHNSPATNTYIGGFIHTMRAFLFTLALVCSASVTLADEDKGAIATFNPPSNGNTCRHRGHRGVGRASSSLLFI